CSIVLLFFVRYPWFFLHPPAPLPHLHSFPTRRSSDLLFVPPSVRSRIRRIELTGRRPCDKVLWVYILWRLRQFLRQGGAFHACDHYAGLHGMLGAELHHDQKQAETSGPVGAQEVLPSVQCTPGSP